ncbi:ribbon-helix-helix domain-containing protein [Tardiphaga sp. 172_B4_N1_3]|uniref:ribbon-helix-helix domain-containing protein n=1 Tax=Tardiphaga sp. 172_B4_N1_3 TaxID=3240787 RepID=UPI003F88C7AE
MPDVRKPTKPRKQSFTRPDGTSTSISLEEAFWEALKEIANEKRISPTDLTRQIDRDRVRGNLTSTIRLFVLEHFIAKYRSATDPNADRQRKARSEEGVRS